MSHVICDMSSDMRHVFHGISYLLYVMRHLMSKGDLVTNVS